MAELFGWEVNKKKKEATKAKSFVAPSDEEGTLDIAGGAGFFGQYMSYDKAARNEFDLIRKYRTTAENPEYMPLYWFQGGKSAFQSLTPVK